MTSGRERNRLWNQLLRKNCESEQAWQDHDERNHHFESCADDRSHFGAANVLGSKNALNDQEIRCPVTHGQDCTESEDDAGPMDPHGVSAEVIESRPEVNVLCGEVMGDLQLQVCPTTRLP